MKYKLETDKGREAYRRDIEKFVLEEMDPIAEEIERTGVLPEPNPIRERFNKEWEVPKLPMPKEWGGYGLTMEQYMPIEETGAKGHGLVRGAFHGPAGMWRCIYLFGSQEQKARWMPEYAQGRGLGFCLTEPGHGSGLDIATEARIEGDHFVINGDKHLISFADTSPGQQVVALTDKTTTPRALSYIIVERGTPGLTIRNMAPFMGFHVACHLEFRNCKVPLKNVIGKLGQGREIALHVFLDVSRLSIAICAVGVCQRLLELSLGFVPQRVTFGKPISERQSIQVMLAEMATDIHASRLINADACRKYDAGTMTPKDSSMAKVFAIEMSQRVSDRAIFIHGGMGYNKALPVERLYRDVRSLWFEEGTPSIQKRVIAWQLLGKS